MPVGISWCSTRSDFNAQESPREKVWSVYSPAHTIANVPVQIKWPRRDAEV